MESRPKIHWNHLSCAMQKTNFIFLAIFEIENCLRYFFHLSKSAFYHYFFIIISSNTLIVKLWYINKNCKTEMTTNNEANFFHFCLKRREIKFFRILLAFLISIFIFWFVLVSYSLSLPSSHSLFVLHFYFYYIYFYIKNKYLVYSNLLLKHLNHL